jgi:hypothetical protein
VTPAGRPNTAGLGRFGVDLGAASDPRGSAAPPPHLGLVARRDLLDLLLDHRDDDADQLDRLPGSPTGSLTRGGTERRR